MNFTESFTEVAWAVGGCVCGKLLTSGHPASRAHCRLAAIATAPSICRAGRPHPSGTSGRRSHPLASRSSPRGLCSACECRTPPTPPPWTRTAHQAQCTPRRCSHSSTRSNLSAAADAQGRGRSQQRRQPQRRGRRQRAEEPGNGDSGPNHDFYKINCCVLGELDFHRKI